MNCLCQRGALVLGLFLSLAVARGQYSFSDENPVGSVSGQFLVSSVGDPAPPSRNLNPTANTNVIQLKTALLAISAERFKVCLWEQLGIPANALWSGKIFLVVHAARSLDETETIASSPFLNHWNYRVELPDMLWKTRYARTLSGVLLLEIANRTAARNGHSAEVPAWLVDGIAQQVLAADSEEVLLSAPHMKKGDEIPVARINHAERGFDPLADARQILRNTPALTFDQLSWPTEEQMNGADGGVYFASAQLFQSELLGLKNGREKMRAMLAELPDCLNWQTAFLHAFASDFKRPLDVEKWWALRVVNFAMCSAGPRWTTEVSLNRLQELLSVPVEFRTGSNALPSHAEISLQNALQNLNPEQRGTIVRTKIRDLALEELRLAPPFGELADGYRVALMDYLGESKSTTRVSVFNKHRRSTTHQVGLADTLKKLDALDLQRRTAESKATTVVQAHSEMGTQ